MKTTSKVTVQSSGSAGILPAPWGRGHPGRGAGETPALPGGSERLPSRYTSLAASLLVAAGYGSYVSAHTQTGSLGTGAGAIDFYLVSCTTGDAANGRLDMSVSNATASSPLLSVQVQKDDLAANTTDAAGGDGQFSPLVQVTGGDGAYFVTVDKVGAGTANYSLEFHCKTGGGVHTGNDTDIVVLQNESSGQDAPPSPPGPVDEPALELPPPEIVDRAIEGVTLYTGFATTHGCTNKSGTDPMMPVVAQSLLFPNNEDSLAFAIDPATGAQTPTNLADHIQGANGGVLTLSPNMVQDKNVFKKQREVTDANGRVRGIQYTGGKLETTAVGVIPFRVSGPKFLIASCAKSLKVRIAIGNWCTTSTNAGQDDRADIWIGDMTPLFNDPGVMPNGFETSPFWPTLTVDRDLAANPLDGACGAGYDIAVQPSEADIDAHLPIKGFWPN